jgi:hypothetical protein
VGPPLGMGVEGLGGGVAPTFCATLPLLRLPDFSRLTQFA